MLYVTQYKNRNLHFQSMAHPFREADLILPRHGGIYLVLLHFKMRRKKDRMRQKRMKLFAKSTFEISKTA